MIKMLWHCHSNKLYKNDDVPSSVEFQNKTQLHPLRYSACAGVIWRVSNFNNGQTALRQAAAGFMEAKRGFRRIKGYKQIPSLIIAFESETDKLNHHRLEGGGFRCCGWKPPKAP